MSEAIHLTIERGVSTRPYHLLNSPVDAVCSRNFLRLSIVFHV